MEGYVRSYNVLWKEIRAFYKELWVKYSAIFVIQPLHKCTPPTFVPALLWRNVFCRAILHGASCTRWQIGYRLQNNQARLCETSHAMVNTLIRWFPFMVSKYLTIFLGSHDLVIYNSNIFSFTLVQGTMSISEEIYAQGVINPIEKSNERTRWF